MTNNSFLSLWDLAAARIRLASLPILAAAVRVRLASLPLVAAALRVRLASLPLVAAALRVRLASVPVLAAALRVRLASVPVLAAALRVRLASVPVLAALLLAGCGGAAAPAPASSVSAPQPGGSASSASAPSQPSAAAASVSASQPGASAKPAGAGSAPPSVAAANVSFPSEAPRSSTGAPGGRPPLNPIVHLKVGSLSLPEPGFSRGLAEGYFGDEGIDVELVPFQSGNQETPVLASGELQVGSTAPDPGIFNAIARGVDMKIVASMSTQRPGEQTGALIVRQDWIDSGKYKTIADLKGATIGLPGLGTTAEMYVERMLAKGNLTAADVKYQQVGMPDGVALMKNKGVDAVFEVQPFIAAIQSQNAGKPVAFVGDVVPGFNTDVLLYGPSFIQKQPEVAQRFMIAFLRGQRDYYRAFVENKGGQDSVIQDFARYSRIKDPNTWKLLATFGIDPNGSIDVSTLEQMQDYFLKAGTQKDKIDMAKAVDLSYAQNAAKILGPVD
jgi:NitT/TauT family transport system substrate-binding protein